MANTVSRTISDDTLNRIIQIESAGNPNAKAPTSSAAGLGQFINATWLATVQKHRRDLMSGGNVPSRFGTATAALQLEMLARFTEDNARGLGPGYQDGDLYLAHFLGLGAARAVLRASAETPVAQVVSAGAIDANRSILSGKTCGQVRAWAQQSMVSRWDKAGRPDWVKRYAAKGAPEKPPVQDAGKDAAKVGGAAAGGAVIVTGGAAVAADQGWGWIEWTIVVLVLAAVIAAGVFVWRWWKERNRAAEIRAAGTQAVEQSLEGDKSWNSTGDQSQESSPLSPPSLEPSLEQLSAARSALSLVASQEAPSPQPSGRKRRRTPSAKRSQRTRKRPTSSRVSKNSAARKSSRKRKPKSRGRNKRA